MRRALQQSAPHHWVAIAGAPTAGMPQLLTMGEAADISRLSVATLRRRISEGSLAAHRVGPRVLRVDRDSLLALIGSPIRGD